MSKKDGGTFPKSITIRILSKDVRLSLSLSPFIHISCTSLKWKVSSSLPTFFSSRFIINIHRLKLSLLSISLMNKKYFIAFYYVLT